MEELNKDIQDYEALAKRLYEDIQTLEKENKELTGKLLELQEQLDKMSNANGSIQTDLSDTNYQNGIPLTTKCDTPRYDLDDSAIIEDDPITDEDTMTDAADIWVLEDKIRELEHKNTKLDQDLKTNQTMYKEEMLELGGLVKHILLRIGLNDQDALAPLPFLDNESSNYKKHTSMRVMGGSNYLKQ
eukprot:UN28592